jgi:hypothetical protein
MINIFKNIIFRETPLVKIYIFAAVFVLITVGIIIQNFSLKKLDDRISKIQTQIAEQNGLKSVYQLLRVKGHKADKILPFPEKRNFPRNQVEALAGSFRDIAKKANMDILYVTPALNSIGPDSRYLLVDVGIRGDFLSYRDFLIALGNLSCLDRIEEMQIQEDTDVMEFKLKIRLSMG